MINNPLAECMLSIMNSKSQTSAEHDKLANAQQSASQLEYSPLQNNCSSEQTTASTVIVTTSAKALWRIDLRDSRNAKKTYVATVVLDKSAKQSVEAVTYGINAANDKSIRDFGNNWYCNRYPLYDGDAEIPNNAKPDNYRGKYYLYARSYVKPIIVDGKGKLLQDNDKVYVGLSKSQYDGSVAMSFYPYNNQDTGISCALECLVAVKAAGCLTGDSALAFAKSAFSQFFKQ